MKTGSAGKEGSYLLLGFVSSTSRSKPCGARIVVVGGETVEELCTRSERHPKEMAPRLACMSTGGWGRLIPSCRKCSWAFHVREVYDDLDGWRRCTSKGDEIWMSERCRCRWCLAAQGGAPRLFTAWRPFVVSKLACFHFSISFPLHHFLHDKAAAA